MDIITVDPQLFDTTPDPRTMIAEASDLGWRSIPRHISYKGVVYAMGQREIDREGDVVAWHYVARNGDQITVFND